MDIRRCALVFVLLLAAENTRADEPQLQTAVAICRQAGVPEREPQCSFLFGLSDILSGNVGGARLHLEEAGQRLEAAGDPVGAWKALWVLAEYEIRFERRRPDLRLATREKALAVVERAKRAGAPFRLDRLAEFGDILNGSPRAPGSFKSLVLQLLEAVTREGYAAALLDLGELEKADVQLGMASELARPFGAMLDRSIARTAGQLRRRQWRLDEARESYRKALAAPKTRLPFTVDDREEGEVGALSGLAEIEMLGGRTDEALGWNDRALALTRAAGERKAELSLLTQRATLLERGGRFAAAEQVYANALAIANGDGKEQAMLLMNRASMYMDRGRYGAAIADNEKSLELIATVDDPLLESMLLARVASTYLDFAAHDSAASALEKARTLAARSGSDAGTAFADVIAAGSTGRLADMSEAFERFRQLPEVRGAPDITQTATLLRAMAEPNPVIDHSGPALEGGVSEFLEVMPLFAQDRFPAAREAAMRALAQNSDTELRAALFTIIAVTFAAEFQWDQCIDYAKRASDALDSSLDGVPVDDLLSGFLGKKRTQFDLLIEVFVMANRGEEAFEVSERARARAFLQLVGNRRIRPRNENSPIAREAEALRAQIAQWQQQARVAPSKELENDLRGARRRFAGLRTRVQASDPEYSAITSVDAAPLEAIRTELPSSTTLISYYLSLNMVHAWVLDRTTIEYVQLQVDAAWLESAVCAARRFGRGGRGVRVADTPCDAVTLDEMHERLFAPLRKHVRNQRLIIVPHLSLHYLPFAAFRNPRTQRYLIEDYTITYAPSASSIRFLHDKETPVNGTALVIGAPAGVSPALPGALREAMVVAAELRSQPRVGAAAKERLLYQLKGDVDLIHIAAHGFYEPDTPLFSRIALAAGNGSDGDLQVHEILSGLDLTGVNLVVLATCQSAVGKGSDGDDVVGLTRALLYAGTPGVISTLWDIGDNAAAELMSHFYCHLLNGASAADALRHAQLQLLHGDYPDPRQWAAFTLHGDPEGCWNPSGAIEPVRKSIR